MTFPPDKARRRSARRLFLAAGVAVVLAAGGYLVYRSGVVQKWFVKDSENTEEMARLRDAPPQVSPPANSSAEWPQWFGPLRDGRAPAGPFRTDWDKRPPKEIWSVPCGGGFSSMAVVGGRVYTQDRSGGDERVLCLDAATGHTVWQHPYPANYKDIGYGIGPRAVPTVEGKRVYAVGAAGAFLCLESPDAPGGAAKELWRHDLPREFQARVPQWGYACSPLVDGDQVIVQPGGRDGTVAAFDKATGALKWKFGANPAGYSSPVAATVHGVRTVFALTGDSLLCLRADGLLMGSFEWGTSYNANIATPVVLDDYVFISAAYNQGCALLRVKPDGERVKLEVVYQRRNKPLRSHFSTPVASGKYLYGFDTEQGRLICLNYVDGREVEGWDAKEVKKGSLILARDHLIILTETGDLILADATPDEFRMVAKVPTGFGGAQNWTLPVLVDGRLYLRGADKLICLDVRP
ncbi:MAG: hypothetical protein JWO38_230 [Gemmataceae bacterium]|nr:hypothetical protein [Gemmataceae bacterium]